MSIAMLVEVAGELGRGCGSSAWIFTNLAVQNWIIGMHHPQAQDDVWGRNPDALCASSFPTQGGSGRYVDGGIVLNGLWSYASGIDFVDWENLQVFIPKEGGPPDHRFVLVPKQDFTIKDDWFVNGLCGTGSKSIEFKDVFVPEHRVLNTQLIGGGPSPGSAVNPGPLYKVPPFSVGTKVFSGVCLGLACGAFDMIVEEMSTRLSVGRVKMAELPTVQVRVAEASAEIDAAEALLLKDCEDAMRIGASGEKPPLLQRARWRLNNAFAGQLCLRAIERLHPLIGARGLGQNSLFLLAWRDIHAAVSQITMAWDIQVVNAGRVQFGLPAQDPRL
ncbi:MAG TPA: acyl-CoA dehydrogenase family protein, partial [Xanthobacteraceae bacterium]|nr:acyl-CoA dehydrogenase family protein [Xanthobacteraceae bacterium]